MYRWAQRANPRWCSTFALRYLTLSYSTSRPGKHLAFDGRLLHGAPHTLTPATTPAVSVDEPHVRATFMVNIWMGHRPRGLERLPAALAAQLQSAAAVEELGEAAMRVGEATEGVAIEQV